MGRRHGRARPEHRRGHANAPSVALAWQFDTWRGVLPLVAVVLLAWRGRRRDDRPACHDPRVLDRGLDTGKPKLAALLAVLVAAGAMMAVTAIGDSAGIAGWCFADRGVERAVSCPPVGPWTYIAVSALPGLIAAYLFQRPPHWPAAGVLWCVPLLAVIGAVRCLQLATAPADGIDWPWLAGAPVLAAVAVAVVVRWARGHAEREGAGVLVGLLLIACIPVGALLGLALTAIVT